MFIVTEDKLEGIPPNLADLDFIDATTWSGVTRFTENRQQLIFGGRTVDVPVKIRHPIVRCIDSESALVIHARTSREVKNAWIIGSEGTVRANFYAGDAIEDVIVAKDFIVVTYFDESYCSSDEVECGRVTVFDLKGQFLFGYTHEFSTDAVEVFDCYAASLVGDNKIMFFPYTEFPLVILDLKTRTQQVWKAPPEVEGSGAISKSGDRVYFYSPYGDEAGMYQWQMGTKTAERIGEHPGCIRGLRGGRFLSLRDSDYAIITLK